MKLIVIQLIALLAVGCNAQLDTCEGCLASVGVLADYSASDRGIAVSFLGTTSRLSSSKISGN